VDLGMVLELFDTEPSITVDSNGVFIDGTIDEGTEILVAIDFEPPMHDKPTYQVTEKGWKDYTPPAHRPSPNPSLN
jgi:hypothetical protein